MAKQLGGTGKVDGSDANCGLAPGVGRETAAPAPLARRWRAFLTGPRLPPGPALAVIIVVSLLAWAGIIGLFYYYMAR